MTGVRENRPSGRDAHEEPDQAVQEPEGSADSAASDAGDGPHAPELVIVTEPMVTAVVRDGVPWEMVTS